MKLSYTVTVKRPVNEVFDYLTDFSNHEQIFSANIESKQVSEGPVGIGTKMTCVSKFMGKRMEEHFIVTSFSKNEYIAKKSLPGSSLPTSDTMTVRAVDGGTEITIEVLAEPKGFLKLAAPLIRAQADKILSKDIKNLKLLLEAEPVVTN